MTKPAPCVPMDRMVSTKSPGVTIHTVPLIAATAESLRGYGTIVTDFENETVRIETWPQPDWRRVEPGTGDEGGITEGDFEIRRQGDLMVGRNHAVDGHYITGWFTDPAVATAEGTVPNYNHVLVREANYHPDGGQVFFPRECAAFVALLALPGDDVRPEHFIAFYFDGNFGVQIHPGIWHQPVFPLAERAVFKDKQGKVHACVAVDFVKEFSTYLSVPLVKPPELLAAGVQATG